LEVFVNRYLGLANHCRGVGPVLAGTANQNGPFQVRFQPLFFVAWMLAHHFWSVA